jgi:hypothetical protein
VAGLADLPRKLVEYRKEAQTVYYKIKDPRAKKVVTALYEIYCGKA